MNLGLSQKKRFHVREIPLAPVLDLLTVVVFFLLLSASFDVFRQHIVPPAQIVSQPSSAQTEPDQIPLNPKLLVDASSDKVLRVSLIWGGAAPGAIVKQAKELQGDYLSDGAQNIATEFKNKFPNEKALQIGFTSDTPYQKVLEIYDGVAKEYKDLVFISNAETDTLVQGQQ